MSASCKCWRCCWHAILLHLARSNPLRTIGRREAGRGGSGDQDVVTRFDYMVGFVEPWTQTGRCVPVGVVSRSPACRPFMDSSVSPTRGEQELSVWNGHYAYTCYHPLFVFNHFGDLERCALRPGNVHYRDKVSRL